MRIELKRKVGTKWKGIPTEELIDETLLGYMEKSEDSIVAAVFAEDKRLMIVSNDEAYVKMYEESTTTFHSSDLTKMFIGETQQEINLIAKVFPDSTTVKIGVG